MEKQIETLTELGTEAVQAAIANYTHWFVVSSLCWLAMGAVFAVAAVWLWRNREPLAEKMDLPESIIYLVIGILVFLSLLTIPCNVPDLLAPRAIAIHQLIRDAKK